MKPRALILREGTADPTAGSETPPEQKPDQKEIDRLVAGGEAISLDGKPIVLDGKTYTPEQLRGFVTGQKKVESELAQIRGEYQEVLEDLKFTYGPQAAEQVDKAKASMRRILVRSGYEGADIDRELEAVFGEEEEHVEPNENTGGGQNQRVAIPDEVQKQMRMSQSIQRQIIQQNIDATIDQQLGAGELGALLEGIGLRDNEEMAGKARALLKREFDSALKAALRKDLDTHGDFQLDWIGKRAIEVAKDIAGKARVLAGDPRKIGRAPLPGEDRASQAILERDPVERVLYDPSLSKEELARRREDRVVDRFSRLAAKEALSSGGSVA